MYIYIHIYTFLLSNSHIIAYFTLIFMIRMQVGSLERSNKKHKLLLQNN